jgi:hypothetical protein
MEVNVVNPEFFDIDKFVTEASILDGSGTANRQSVKVIKYKNGQPVSEEWVTADHQKDVTWKSRQPESVIGNCYSCKKDFEAKSRRKVEICKPCAKLKKERLSRERTVKEKAERVQNPNVRLKYGGKYSYS